MYNEGHYKQGEKAAYRMVENNSKQKQVTKYTSGSRSSIPEKQTTHKVGQRTKQTFLQRKHTDG